MLCCVVIYDDGLIDDDLDCCCGSGREVEEAQGGENIEGDWPGSHSAGALRRASFARTIRPLKRTKSNLGTP